MFDFDEAGSDLSGRNSSAVHFSDRINRMDWISFILNKITKK